jgi:hypothetical protein
VSAAPEKFGRYLLLKRLGAGGGGDVHLARNIERARGSRIVVVKRLHGQLADREDFVRRFKHEAELATLVDSPYVTKVFELGELEGVLYIIQEYVAGWPLSNVITELKDAEQRPPLGAVVDLAQGALAGLEALHTATKDGVQLGIVHRDIAPKNIMLRANGDACLIDLGIGKSRMQEWKTATGVVMGSPGYMAPEHVTGKELDHRADLFSMAVTIWEIFAVRSYSHGSVGQKMLASAIAKYIPLSTVRSDVPPALDAVLERAMARDPAARYPSALAFATALREAVPERGSRAWFVERMSLEELDRDETEVRALVARPLPELFDPQSAGSMTIYASRVEEAPVSLRTWVAIGGGVLVLSSAVMIGVLTLVDQAGAERPAPVLAPPPPPAKSVVIASPRAQPIAVEQKPEPVERVVEEKKARNPPSRKSAPAAADLQREPPPKPEPAPVQASGKERVAELIARARRLRAEASADDRRARAEDLLSALMLARDSLAFEPARLAGFERQIAEMENKR